LIKIYNTLTRKLDEFKPIVDKKVGIYSCGPTVYWNQHIGHMYAYVQWDTLVRFLGYSGFEVKWVMNITDVGHLTSDEDAGEDKMEKGAKREGLTVWQIADKYLVQFKESMQLMNINPPDILARATEHIPDQIELIKKIEANGFTYKTKTGLVFDTGKFPGYADFARLNLKNQEAGARVEVDPEKKKPWDFLLWVTNQPEHIMQWDSPWGRGFPGWHIECTAMSTKYLGDQFDIHTGGKEHIPVHHTNEVAQAFGAFGRQTANYWLHNNWLTFGGEKISKSSGNFMLVSDVVEKGFKPLALRYLILTSHYRQGLNFSWESLQAAQTAYNKLVELIGAWRSGNRTELSPEKLAQIDQFRNRFVEALSTDLNTAEALSAVWQTAKSNIPNQDKLDLILDFDQVLGLNLAVESIKETVIEIPAEVEKLIQAREVARLKKDWNESDNIRKKVEELGFTLEDTPQGTKVQRIDR
jgi:cysteinyl-tRNA synthetase